MQSPGALLRKGCPIELPELPCSLKVLKDLEKQKSAVVAAFYANFLLSQCDGAIPTKEDYSAVGAAVLNHHKDLIDPIETNSPQVSYCVECSVML